MNEWLSKLLTQIKNLWSKWTLIQKLILAAIIVAVIVGFVTVFSVSAKPTTVALFNVAITDETARDKILFRLSEENVSATVNAAGMISVNDAATARRMRSILVREDLVPKTVDPWALFDVERWTITDYERDINKRRAITDAVTRHIEALDDVDRANLVITFPPRELFAADQSPVTASVIIYQKPGSDIVTNKKKVEGIQKLVLYAVEGLKSENITITDSAGNIINDFGAMAEFDRVNLVAQQQKLISALEAQYRDKVLRALQQTFTADRVRDLNIKIDMDMSKKEVDATEYSPIVIRPDNPDTPFDDSEIVQSITLSSQTVTKRWQGTGWNPQGPAGVEGQNPPVYSDLSNLYGLSEESGVTKNEAVNKRQVREEKNPTIERITVSVNIDGTWQKKYDDKNQPVILPSGMIEREYKPVDSTVLVEAQKLVQDAIGYNRLRGDSVSVQNIMFDRTALFLKEDALYLQQRNTRNSIMIGLASILILLILFIVYRVITRELERRRRLREEEILRKHQMEREKTLWEAEQAGVEVSMSVEERKRLELQENAINLAKEHPEDVALLIRTWLMEE